jgi:hypothetical protein
MASAVSLCGESGFEAGASSLRNDDGDELRFAAGEAADFLKLLFFDAAEGMIGFGIQVELFVSASKLVVRLCLQ